MTGKLSGTGTRVASASGNFQYDAAGNMVEDRSKNMAISYGDDGMPTLIKADSVLRLRPLYDASGYRVSQAALRTFPEGYPDYWVGNPQTSLEDDFAYDVSTLDEALYRADTAMNIWNSPAPDSLVFFVVLDQGDTSMTPAWDSLTAIAKDDTLVPVRVYGMRKFSARYDSLRSLREGRLLAARHWVSLGGQVLGEVTEGYDSTETLVSTRLVAPLYGRGTPVGRVVHTDTGEVTQFYVKNHLGSTMRVVNVDGSYATTPTFDYQAYGEPQVVRDDTLNSAGPRYTGKELDTEVNLYYFGARWYDAELGMWMTVDPARQFYNPYSYGGNPVSYVDPDGEFIITAIVIGAVVGGYIGGVRATGSYSLDGFDITQDWDEVLVGAGIGAATGVAAAGAGAGAAGLGTWALGGQAAVSGSMLSTLAVGSFAGATAGAVGGGVNYALNAGAGAAGARSWQGNYSWSGFGRAVGYGAAAGAVGGFIGSGLAPRMSVGGAGEVVGDFFQGAYSSLGGAAAVDYLDDGSLNGGWSTYLSAGAVGGVGGVVGGIERRWNYARNQNPEQAAVEGMSLDEFRAYAESKGMVAGEYPENMNIDHRPHQKWYMASKGAPVPSRWGNIPKVEGVFDAGGSWVFDLPTMATYNHGSWFGTHFGMDMSPYYVWGNGNNHRIY